jgi:hypothetical protein
LVDDDIEDEVSITVLATGFGGTSRGSDSSFSSNSDVPDFLSGR